MPPRFLMIAGYAPSLLGFRAPLIAALQAAGLQVHVAAPELDEASPIRTKLEVKGLVVHSVPMQRTGQNPLADIATLKSLYSLMRSIRPDYVMGYTIKPVIYGALAAWFARVPKRFALITGLGYAFQNAGERSVLRMLLRSVVQQLYKVSMRRLDLVFFQNPDDRDFFIQSGLLNKRTRAVVVNGSGVDVEQFVQQPLPQEPPSFLLIARLLGDKGVREYAAAARRVRDQFPQACFRLVGWIDENPDAITRAELDQWIAEGTLEYLGHLDDVRPAIVQSSVYVLPSYYPEGTPRTVLEAMATGRPIITTDAPGCRETVVEGENGFLVPVRSVDALVDAMLRFVEELGLVARMGQRSRQLAEEKYDVRKVNAVMLGEMGVR